MQIDRIREYIIVKDTFDHATLEEVNCYQWEGDLVYTDEIHRMLNEVFRMNKLSTEMSYVIALDHAKNPKGICKIGQGDANATPTSMQNIFTFLLLSGAYSFILIHNHVSKMPNPSPEDKTITMRAGMFANMFDMEFIGHMIIHPEGYTIDGGVMAGTTKIDDIIETELPYELIGNGMAATYIFGQRIEGTIENIKKLIE